MRRNRQRYCARTTTRRELHPRLELLEDRRLLAAPRLVKDIEDRPASSMAITAELVATDTFALVPALTTDLGIHGWFTDGTAEGTRPLWPDRFTPRFDDFSPTAAVGGEIYFFTSGFANDNGLWKTDGTDEGTVLVKQLPFSFSTAIAPVGDGLYFTWLAGAEIELWKSDGTTEGTAPIAVLPNDTGSPQQFVDVQGRAFFTAGSEVTGRELWTSDGTAEGTRLVKDIRDGGSSFPDQFAAVDEFLYFTANDGVHGREVWRTDGTEAGTELVADLREGDLSSQPQGLIAWEDAVYFSAEHSANDGVSLWRADADGVSLVHKFDAGFVMGDEIARLGDQLYFFGDDGVDSGIWTSDGASGAAFAFAVAEGDVPSLLFDFVTVGDTLYFRENGVEAGIDLWATRGGDEGAVKVFDAAVTWFYSSPMTSLGDKLLFIADDAVTGDELWTSDGTSLVKDLAPGTRGSNPSQLTKVGDQLYFTLYEELWRSDGTSGGTTLVTDIVDTDYYDYNYGVQEMAALNGQLYFVADMAPYGQELWTTDGTPGGTRVVKDLAPGVRDAAPHTLFEVDGNLFFSARTVASDALWKTDGTAAGTVRLKSNLSLDPDAKSFHALANVDGTFYFAARTAAAGMELWKSDGTEAGTVLVKDISPGAANSFPSNMVALDGMLYFTIGDATSGDRLWRSDGTAEGTVQVKDVLPGVSGAYISSMVRAGNQLFFLAREADGAQSLWTSDGSPQGTVRVRDAGQYFFYSYYDYLTAVDDRVYFVALSEESGAELWTSNGVPEQTGIVRDIWPGAGGSNPKAMTEMNGLLTFTANDGVHGAELWITDGTAAGSKLLADLNVGPANGRIEQLTVVHSTLFFSGNNGLTGDELFVLDAVAMPLDGDADADGDVDITDLNLVRNHFGATGFELAGDVNFDTFVDIVDLNAVRRNFGASNTPVATRQPAPPERAIPTRVLDTAHRVGLVAARSSDVIAHDVWDSAIDDLVLPKRYRPRRWGSS